mmetsp:Transcript_15717/g.33277  ORF Transcript_15717/g.33277 Transcript_15717/m.33277 type:complete len:82 (-) Transcript_15717:606-851(-)
MFQKHFLWNKKLNCVDTVREFPTSNTYCIPRSVAAYKPFNIRKKNHFIGSLFLSPGFGRSYDQRNSALSSSCYHSVLENSR